MAAEKFLNETGLTYYHGRLKRTFVLNTEYNNFKSQTDERLYGLASAVDDLIAVGAQANVIEIVKVNGSALTPDANKAVDVSVPTRVAQLTDASNYALVADVPTKTSDLTNDSSFQNATQVQSAIDAALADITGVDFQIVQTLPQSGEKGVIYLVPNSGSGANTYDEYIWLEGSPSGRFEKIGTTDVDLSGHWAKSELTAITTAQIDALFE